jgi:hypothetical protein
MTTTTLLNLPASVHSFFVKWWEAFVVWVVALRPLPNTAELLLVIIPIAVLLVGFVIGAIWRKGAYRPLVLVAMVVLFGGFGMANIAMPVVTAGQPDMRCGDFKGGDAPFLLDSAFTTAMNPLENAGPKWLVLMVRSPELFGSDLHTCVVVMDSPLARRLTDIPVVKQELYSDGYSRGKSSFTFNGAFEDPNALPVPGVPQDKGEPDEPVKEYGA